MFRQNFQPFFSCIFRNFWLFLICSYKPCFKAAGGTRLNPCEKRLVNLRDRANMITEDHTACKRFCWDNSTTVFLLRTNSIQIVFYVCWWKIPIVISVFHLFAICWFFAAVCFIFPVVTIHSWHLPHSDINQFAGLLFF